MKGHRSLETLCTICKTMVGVKLHFRAQLPDEHKVARHAVPGVSRSNDRATGRRLPICTGSGIVVSERVVFRVEASA